jgi:glutamate carboxypeptidase
VSRCAAELARRCAAIGGRVDVIHPGGAGDHVRAAFGAGATRVLLLGHTDTVWPVGTLSTMPVERRDGRLHGPGVFDMKAGLAIGLGALRTLFGEGGAAAPAVEVVLLATSDEEIGSATSRALIEDEARRAAAVLVLEPALADGGVKTGRKGVGEFRIELTGIAAHAGLDPASGASAIRELARQTLALEALADPARGTTLNVGVVGGGTRSNVVAAGAWALVDARVTSQAEAARVSAAIAGLRPVDGRVGVRVSGGINRPPMERTPAVLRLYDEARAVAAELGRSLTEAEVGGASDGNFTAALGVPTLDGLGAVGEGAHALHEHVEVGSLSYRAVLLAGLIRRLAGAPAR